MSNNFPETAAKRKLRIDHYKHIIETSDHLGRHLVYFGLPSAEMLDVRIWRTHLEHIFAVERDPDVASKIYRTAGKLKIHNKLTVIERDLMSCVNLLTLNNDSLSLTLGRLNTKEQEDFTSLRKRLLDIVYLDMYGGFLYERQDDTNTNTEILKGIFLHQKQFKKPFSLILTYNLKTKGADEFDRFNKEFLDELSNAHSVDATKLKQYYLSENIDGHPQSMRRMRLALPIHIMNLGKDSFEVSNVKTWLYGDKTYLYHTRIDLKPRLAGSLGVSWPPIDEVRRILSEEVIRLSQDSNGDLIETSLEAPTLSKSNANT